MSETRASRLASTLIDQFAFSSLSFVTTLLVAQGSSAAEFGDFALMQLGFTLLLGLTRTTVAQSTLLEARSDRGRPSSTGAMLTVLVGVVVSAALWVPYLVDPAPRALWLGILGTALAPMMTLDVARHALHGLQRPAAACTVSVLAGAGYVVTMCLGWTVGASLPVSALSAMCVGPCVGVAAAVIALGELQSADRLRPWLREHAREWRDAALGFAANSTGFILVPVILAVVAGSAAAGALRAGQVIVGFAQQFPNGMSLMMLERSATATSRRSGRVLDRLMWAWIGGSLPVFAALLAVAVFWPALGQALLGDTWPQTSRIVLPLIVSGFLTCVSLGLEVQLRALRAPRITARARTAGVLAICLLVTVGAHAHGLVGGAFGLLIGNCIQVVALTTGRRRVIGAARWTS